MRLAIVAGEASGDLHAAEVLRELKVLAPGLTAFGIGGDLLQAEGVTLLHHAREMGIVGLFNVLRHLRMFRRIFDDLMQRIESERPDAVLLVDYPGFNLRVAKRCRRLGLKVVYYISPQVWAWRRGRVKQIARNVDRMIVILPFEEAFYREHGVKATYAGHPLIDELAETLARPRCASPEESPSLRIALLPGSRTHEVDSLLPAMLDAVAILGRERAVEARVVQAPTIAAEHLEHIMKRHGLAVPIVAHDAAAAVAESHIALSSSGTATLEAAVVGTPTIVMYHLSRATYWMALHLVKVPYFSLINIIADAPVVPEMIQNQVRGDRIAAEVRKLIEPATYARVCEQLAEVRRRLGAPGASRRAAEAIMDALQS